MRFSLVAPLVTAFSMLGFAAASLEVRQEAVRFGIVSVSPPSVKPGQPFLVTYNSTLARWQPKYLDVYIQGIYANNFATPYVQLLRADYGNDTRLWAFETTLPVLSTDSNDGYIANASYSVWAFITFPTDTGALEVGGVAAPIGVILS